MISGSGEICAKCVHMYALAGPVTSIRLALSFHSAMTMAFPGIQPNIVMPMKLLLSCLNAEDQQVNFNGHLDRGPSNYFDVCNTVI